ncbi:hypothetical protein A3A93_01700 [Candidatus Roizmanbacteria bacterium RIFCSPLOWO2_01_FULL_38_12]|uniref:histidine kinase n=1 Tax=Candidatus Roizmanbacteria bacterium RIFCSPLOWO2_01_FULL_38_12 TaxID=1802061 RepID=A0A1F7IY95_9BACT|nr:MAG: hypothetical protein A2861_02305 [Candidatus Roizmanbacteria bacterium RIFCSPHIGHO2_01_FULL_38_15]OGK34504.1 MAG: hypothetical protein A3F59_04225 [Candidatus Roizmanbacteria bacterium RIFCSPHIGHO2_12_FULL_38_13]OGK48333.1 MAG: hypothetical protein A3A93_01700 [Candidatus Roizmanbacteria bacterium RIFCSPLOWO2_01_FULL_38_12]
MFHSARIKLTGWYLLIIMSVSLAFSIVIYHQLTWEINRFEQAQRYGFERRLRDFDLPIEADHNSRPLRILIENPELVEEIERRVAVTLMIINGGILFMAGALSYFLAGKTLQPIQDMMDEQNRFISDASHELKTPLTSLKTAMEVFLRGKKKNLNDAKTIIGESIVEVNKLQSLSESLLQLAQYQNPNGHTLFEQILISDVVNKAVSNIKPIAKKKNIMIKTDVEDRKIKGNKYSLEDLFKILLDNAVKYSQVNTSVSIISKKTDGYIEIEVKDQGIGIDDKDLPRIFERFYRADIARTKNSHDGYGLGLSIAKKIVEIHHGSIGVKSKVKQETTFIVRLPIKQTNRSS